MSKVHKNARYYEQLRTAMLVIAEAKKIRNLGGGDIKIVCVEVPDKRNQK